ncbi:MAG TPA: UrcA family protein [Gammaproteobacteria bacterium]|nr:UrcA family protein [Gammaproteobacteria bacterium]
MKTLHQTLLAVTGVLSIASFGARAELPTAARSVEISYAQLDLGTTAARDTLTRQIALAAERACGAYEARSLRERNAWRECRAAAFSAGVAQLAEARVATR